MARRATTNETGPPSSQLPADQAPDHVVTAEHRWFCEFADAVRAERYIGLCYCPPGVGKTLSSRVYARWHEQRPLLAHTSAWPFAGTRRPDWHTILYTPTVNVGPSRLDKELCNLAGAHATLRGKGAFGQAAIPPAHGSSPCTELLIVDEADRLNHAAIEQVRDHYNRSSLGLVFIGMPGIEKRLARYPQLYSRIGFVHHYNALNAAELAPILATRWGHLGISEPGLHTDTVLAAVIRITAGNFRLVIRLLGQAERIARINQIDTLTVDVLNAAREVLVIGS